MDPTVDIDKLSPQARKVLDPAGPLAMRQMAAKGIAPGLRPSEAITVVALMAERMEPLADMARQTLGNLPLPLLSGALTPDLHPGVLDVLAPHYAKTADVMERILALPQILGSTVEAIAMRASELVAELIATNEERMLAHPKIIERLYLNKSTRMSTADRILELAVRHRLDLKGIPAFKEAAAAIHGELIPEGTGEETPDDILFKKTERLVQSLDLDPDKVFEVDEETGEERVADEAKEVEEMTDALTGSQKVRRAMLTTKPFERAMYFRDVNRLVAMAAIKNPLVTEDEVARATSSRSLSDDVLAYIARNREWMRSYQIKLNLCTNPRTPMMYVVQLVSHLRESDLKKLAASKNVPGAVQSAARNQLSRKGK